MFASFGVAIIALGGDSRAGVVEDAIFALGWLVLASFGVVAGSYLPLEAVGRR